MNNEQFLSAEKNHLMNEDDSILIAHKLCENFLEDPYGTLILRTNYLREKYSMAIDSGETDLVSLVLDDLLAFIEVLDLKGLKVTDELLQSYIDTDIPLVTEEAYEPELERSFIIILKKIGITKDECLKYYDLSDSDLSQDAVEQAAGIYQIIDEVYGQ